MGTGQNQLRERNMPCKKGGPYIKKARNKLTLQTL